MLHSHSDHDRYRQVTEKIQTLCRQAGRLPEAVTLLAVSKTHPTSTIAKLYESTGHRDFGENYAQHLVAKAAQLAHLPLRWHFIGQLQSNKIAKLVKAADCIHTVASLKHAQAIDRHAKELGKTPYPVFLAVNAADEPQKSGTPLSYVEELAGEIQQGCVNVKVCGLMTVPPAAFCDTAYAQPPALYRQLAALSLKVGDGQLSLGMSNDLRLAIQTGSTCVRIGTAIFGARNDDQPTS